jgi:hypothetical protein
MQVNDSSLNAEQPRPKGKVFVMLSKAGHWMYEVVRDHDEQVLGGGGGFDDEFEAFNEACEQFGHLDLEVVIRTDAGYIVKATGKAPE